MVRFFVFVLVMMFGVGLVDAAAQVVMSERELEVFEDRVDEDNERIWYIRLLNGDVLSGPILKVEHDSAGTAVRIAAPIGRAKVYLHEMAWISTADESYRHRHRTYIMPTAEPIGNDHYAGLWEIAFLYAGAGIGDIVSITAGRTFVPSVPASDQLSLINIKATVYESDNGLVDGGRQYVAVGYNGAWLNARNPFGHAYVVGTWTGRRTQVSTMMFAKVVGPDIYTVSTGSLFNPFLVNYSTGTVGVGLSLDTRISDHHDLHVIGELWNSDITRPANTMLFLGLRTATSVVAMDFGLAVFSAPAVVPLVSFAWTPF